jgi:hypothetical protein
MSAAGDINPEEYGGPKARQIADWVERPDYPAEHDCNDEWDDGVRSTSEDLGITYEKFGGYGRYCQDEGVQEPGYLPCHNCQKSRLYCREKFHMVHQGLLWLGLGDSCVVLPART